jgi:hypothetical protein
MSLEELAFPAIHQLESPSTNGHAAAARLQLRGPLWPAIEMWTAAAPRRLRNKTAAKTPLKSWGRWLEYLPTRKRPRPLEQLLAAKETALAWHSTPQVRELLQTWSQALRQSLRSLEKTAQQKKSAVAQDAAATLEQLIVDWQHAARIADGTTEVLWAYQAVAIARALPEMAQLLAAEEWWPLVDELAAVARDSAALNAVEQPLAMQLLAAELPLTLAYQLPELVHCRDLSAAGKQALATGINELLDGEGVLQQKHWPLQRPLVALWTRCRTLQTGLAGKVLDDETARQYTLAVNELVRATRDDGGQVLSSSVNDKINSRETAELFAAAWRFVPDLRKPKAAAKFQKEVAKIPLAAVENASDATKRNEEKSRDYAAASVSSEWAQVAIFRRSWQPREPLLACSYANDQVTLEIAAGGETLLSGSWSGTLQVHGQELTAEAPWREVCQISDKDVDYLELELQLERGYKIQRQMCLGRKEHFAYLADTVLGQDRADLTYQLQLPLATNVSAAQDPEMREVTVTGEKPRARVLPLALPEWRSEQRQGDFQVTDGSLSLITRAAAQNLCAPLWIDLDPKRHGKPLTWRTLTVAENRVICPADVARGWRVQIAERQWIIYRALAVRGNRTVLGHNLISEFLLAKFKDGTTTNLVEVE